MWDLDLVQRAPHRAAIIDDGLLLVGRLRYGEQMAGIEVVRVHDGSTGLAWITLAAELARRGRRTYVPKSQKTRALRKVLMQHTKADGTDAKAAALLRQPSRSNAHC